MPADNEENLEFSYHVMERKLDYAAKLQDRMETKLGVFLGFTSVVFAGLLPILKSDPRIIGINIFSLGILALISILATLVFASMGPPIGTRQTLVLFILKQRLRRLR